MKMKILFTFLIIQFLLLTIRSIEQICNGEKYNTDHDFCCRNVKVCRKGQGCGLTHGMQSYYCFDYNKPHFRPS